MPAWWTQSAYWRVPANPIPNGTLLFYVVHISHCDEIFISQYIGTPVTDVITSSKCFFGGYLRGPGEGVLQWSNWANFVSQLSFHPYLCTCKNGSNLTKTFYVQIQNMNKISFFSYLGGPGGPYVKPKVTNFLWKYNLMTVQICITRGKNNY